MIGKTRKGDNFGRLIRYLTKEGRGRLLALHNLASDSPEAAVSEMTVAAAQSARTTQPVMHISVSYAQGEQPTPQQMRADARRILKSLGLSENQAVVIAHDDKDHPHFHIAVNRVGPDGKTVSDSQSYARIEGSLRRIEAERGWNAVEGRNAPSPATGEPMRGHRRSREPYEPDVPERVRQALLTATSWKELHREIRSAGWTFEIVQKGKGSGALITGPDGQKVGAGRIDRTATLTQLRRRLGRDPEAVREARMRAARRELNRAAGLAAKAAFAPFLAPVLQSQHRPLRRPRRGLRAPGLR
ncbi:relaxase/mobilization nuclease domain-containing protein [Shimia sp. FJ5]|uniref:relaxase/mobilization nuclease domain-containing protein n=1 Tax=Shimia sp. FJ5 TaxID=3079054 RepID=UPI00293DDD0E|nr:relaxase/mobilization nuclease domain-containing protein [Shimia sp. FJ5]MDV4145836.1 relaxase/mobilization nuclease domain-containing protein [Shimia sp. FJ5]